MGHIIFGSILYVACIHWKGKINKLLHYMITARVHSTTHGRIMMTSNHPSKRKNRCRLIGVFRSKTFGAVWSILVVCADSAGEGHPLLLLNSGIRCGCRRPAEWCLLEGSRAGGFLVRASSVECRRNWWQERRTWGSVWVLRHRAPCCDIGSTWGRRPTWPLRSPAAFVGKGRRSRRLWRELRSSSGAEASVP